MERTHVQQRFADRVQPGASIASLPTATASSTGTSSSSDTNDNDSDWLLRSDSEPLALHDDDLAALFHPDALKFLDLLTTTGDEVTIDTTAPTSEARSRGLEVNQRKRTYEQRKNEMDALTQHAAQFEATLERLKRTAGIPDSHTLAQQRIEAIMLREIARNHQYAIAGLQSQLARDSRRVTLEAMKLQHLHDARRFLATRSRFNAPTTRFAESTRWQDEAGDVFATTFDIVPLPLATSVKQVYDALLFGWFNVEIYMADRFGDTVVREECDAGDASIAHHRLVGSNPSHGVSVETNSVLFTEYTQHSSNAEDAVLVSDFVDTDALYPYVPAQRVRKDMTSAATIQWRSPSTSRSSVDVAAATRKSSDTAGGSTSAGDLSSQPVVVLTMWTQSKLHSRSVRQAISDDQLETLTEETPDHMTDALLAAVNAACMSGSVPTAGTSGSEAALPVLNSDALSL